MGYESGLPASGTITQREHDKINDYEGQKRVDLWGFDGANWNRAIVDSSGRLQAAITGGSAGVQYTEGDVDPTITGTAILWEDSGDTLRAVSTAKPLPVQGTVTAARQASATATLTNVSASVASVTILASNANRLMAMVHNDSTANLFLKFGATASSTSFTVRLKPQAYYELPVPVYTGIIDGIWDVAAGAARVTELT